MPNRVLASPTRELPGTSMAARETSACTNGSPECTCFRVRPGNSISAHWSLLPIGGNMPNRVLTISAFCACSPGTRGPIWGSEWKPATHMLPTWCTACTPYSPECLLRMYLQRHDWSLLPIGGNMPNRVLASQHSVHAPRGSEDHSGERIEARNAHASVYGSSGLLLILPGMPLSHRHNMCLLRHAP
jgi:hypothetical protein